MKKAKRVIGILLTLILILAAIPASAIELKGMSLNEIKTYIESFSAGTGKLQADINESSQTITVTGSVSGLSTGAVSFVAGKGITVDWQADLSGTTNALLNVYDEDYTAPTSLLKISNCTINQLDEYCAIDTTSNLVIDKGTVIRRESTTAGYILMVKNSAGYVTINDGEIWCNSGSVLSSKGGEGYTLTINGGWIHSLTGRTASGSSTGAGVYAKSIVMNGGRMFLQADSVFSTENVTLNNGVIMIANREADENTWYGEEMLTYTEHAFKRYKKSDSFVGIAWDMKKGTQYQADTSTALMVSPAKTKAVWQASGAYYGVKYSLGNNSGFIPVKAVTVTGAAPAPTPYPGTPFTDIASHWGKDSIKWSYEKGLFGGVSATQFAPDNKMNRAMLSTVLYRLEGEPSVSGSAPFSDVVSGQYYADAVAWASNKGVVTGTGNGRFAPNQNISREQLATMLYRYAGLTGETKNTGDLSIFADQSKISSWAKDAVKWAVGEGYLTGKGNGILDPRGQASRAEVSTILQRYSA